MTIPATKTKKATAPATDKKVISPVDSLLRSGVYGQLPGVSISQNSRSLYSLLGYRWSTLERSEVKRERFFHEVRQHPYSSVGTNSVNYAL